MDGSLSVEELTRLLGEAEQRAKEERQRAEEAERERQEERQRAEREKQRAEEAERERQEERQRAEREQQRAEASEEKHDSRHLTNTLQLAMLPFSLALPSKQIQN
ncbi:kinase-like domain protein [Fusarium beomiforme]|uniref:Kinase-like domain protein n=1 Tax=Fusarium beomiforme TaxID=44412 RepID=A0A9P5DPT1_9HYPO|nr:kinase-like domain protein [Fusarium beomiforme]